MSKRIIYTTAAGGVAVVIPTPEALQSMTIEQLAAKDVPAGAAFEIVDEADIPADRTFRNAWERNGRAIAHNIGKARAIAHDKRRAMRATEFAPYDEIISLQIPGADGAAAEAARVAIRAKYSAMQDRINAAQDVAELKTALGA